MSSKPSLTLWYNLQQAGVDNALEVRKFDNDNNKATRLWSLGTPGESGWKQGKVEVSSDGDKMYQVKQDWLNKYMYSKCNIYYGHFY